MLPHNQLRLKTVFIYADRISAKELKRIHQTFENLSDKQIKKARAQSEWPGVPTEKIHRHRIRKQRNSVS